MKGHFICELRWTAGEIETQTENKRMDTKGGSGGVVWDELGDWD